MNIRDELTLLRGKIVELKRTIAESELMAQADLITMRDILDPYQEDISAIRADMLCQIAQRFNDQCQNIKASKERLTTLQRDLP